MNKIKDFIYDKNDLLVALLIVGLAAFIIVSRIDIIMAYPSSLMAEAENFGEKPPAYVPETSQKPHAGNEGSGGEGNSGNGDSGNGDSGNGDSGDGGSGDGGSVSGDTGDADAPDENNGSTQQTGAEPIGQVSIYIEYGTTGSEIAQLLIDAGLIENKQVFYDAVTAAGADTRLQAGNFKIPADASPSQIIRIITN